METDPAVEERIDRIAADAREAAAEFDPPESPPDEEQAVTIAREGVGPVTSAFVEIRTGGRSVYLPPEQYDRLETALNRWLSQYAACFGVDLDGEYQLRTAAELLVETHDAVAVAQVLTGVPERADE